MSTGKEKTTSFGLVVLFYYDRQLVALRMRGCQRGYSRTLIIPDLYCLHPTLTEV